MYAFIIAAGAEAFCLGVQDIIDASEEHSYFEHIGTLHIYEHMSICILFSYSYVYMYAR